MGPACAVADVREDSATVYTSTQKPFDCQLGISELLGFPPEKVRAIWMFGTGGYARDSQGDATADAAVLSQHLKRPVRVQYMRHAELHLVVNHWINRGGAGAFDHASLAGEI